MPDAASATPSTASHETLEPDPGPLPVSGGDTPPAPAPPLGVAVGAGPDVLVASGVSGTSLAAAVAVGVSSPSLRGGCVGIATQVGGGSLNWSHGSGVGSGVEVGSGVGVGLVPANAGPASLMLARTMATPATMVAIPKRIVFKVSYLLIPTCPLTAAAFMGGSCPYVRLTIEA
jgi:hypothetical protein